MRIRPVTGARRSQGSVATWTMKVCRVVSRWKACFLVSVTGADGNAVIGPRLARVRLSWRAAWMAPVILAATVTGYLVLGAGVSAAATRCLYLSHEWWRAWLRPGDLHAPLALVTLWLVALLCY